MAQRTIDKPIPWADLTPAEQEEVRKEFEQHVQKGGADLTKGFYRHTPQEYKRRGATGNWCMTYC